MNPPTIPIAIEDRIALEHFGHVLPEHRDLTVSVSCTAAQRALDAAYQEGWRAGIAERDGAKPAP